MPSTRGLAILLLTLLAVAGCRTAPLVDPLPIYSPLGAEKNRQVIYQGMALRRWVPVSESPGLVVAKFGKTDQHEAHVDITYGDRTISIQYRSSSGLRCEPDGDSCSEIHRAYNRWVAQLAKDIEYEAQVVRIEEESLAPVGAR